MHKLGISVRNAGQIEAEFSLKQLGSMGFARLAEDSIRKIRGRGEHDPGSAVDKILSSSIGGALATWNQPIEVIRVEVIKSVGYGQGRN